MFKIYKFFGNLTDWDQYIKQTIYGINRAV